jgi:hypothetical protein
MKMEQIECSETSAYKIQTPGNHPEENIQHLYLSLLNTNIFIVLCFEMGIILEIHERVI